MLSDVAIRKMRIPGPDEKAYKVADGDGLYLQVNPNGRKVWRFRYRQPDNPAKENMLTFGRHPEVPLKAARLKCEEARTLLAAGKDPSAMREAAKEALGHTFATVAADWLKMYKLLVGPGTYDKAVGQLRDHVLPALGSRPITALTTADARRVLEAIQGTDARETTHRCKSLISRIFQFAAGRNMVSADITWSIKDLLPQEVENQPALTDTKEVGALLREVADYEASCIVNAIALRLAPYVALRPVELRKGEWSEIDWNTKRWNIPADRMKKVRGRPRRAHIVPLSRQAIALLRKLEQVSGDMKLMFPIPSKPLTPMSENAVTTMLENLGYKGKQSGHGFRTTFSTLLNEAGAKLHAHPDWIEMQLAHTPTNKVRGTYNKALYLDDRVIMMQKWADYLDNLRDGVLEYERRPALRAV